MTQSAQKELKIEALRTFGSSAVGLVLLLSGWMIFSNNGYDSASLFFIGSLLIPIGLITLGTGLMGGLGEDALSILKRYLSRGE